jgi:hypothetical protein
VSSVLKTRDIKILTAPQLSISQKDLGTLPEDGNLMSKQLEITMHHVTRRNTPIHNILSTAPQLTISQKALGTLP